MNLMKKRRRKKRLLKVMKRWLHQESEIYLVLQGTLAERMSLSHLLSKIKFDFTSIFI
tara:strand:+ start:1350 stop:1523 length:174 start_codon:yes stop_codon:yes gene_type:complete